MADPWVAPDTQATPPGGSAGSASGSPDAGRAAATAAAGTGTAAAEPRSSAPARVPVPLRPLTGADLLDGGLRVWKLAPRTVSGIAAAFVVPTQVAIGVLTRNDIDDVALGESIGEAFTATGPGDFETGIGGAAFFTGLLAQGAALSLVTAAVAVLVSGWYLGRTAAAGELVAGALRRAPALLVAWVAVHLMELLFAIALVVPAIVPMTWYALVAPVIACEQAGPFRAMRRSMVLANRRFGAVLGVCLLVFLVDLALTFALTAVAGLYVEAGLPAAWAVNTAVAAAAMLVTVPFVAGVATLQYLDARVRTEGLDIELAAGARLATARS